MKPETLTDKLHARADEKLSHYCEQRFGDLFNLCGAHHSEKKPQISSALKQHLQSLGAKNDKFPWHGSVWAIAREVLFATLQEAWREKEVAEFMSKVESMRDEIREIYEQGGAE